MIPKARKSIRAMEEYIPGEQPQGKGFIKLNTNENPYSPSPAAIKAIKAFDPEKARKYPDPMCIELRTFLAKKYNLSMEQIIAGNGSDEILRLLVEGYLEKDAKLAILYPTYTLYKTLCEMREAKLIKYNAMTPDFPMEIASSDADMIMIANPNPPFGTYYSNDTLSMVCAKAKKALVVIDEAYVDFAPDCSVGLLKKFDNVLITRSLSKSFSMAGLRVGYAMGHPEVISNLFKIKDSYNVNGVSQAASLAALKDRKYNDEKLKVIVNEREKLKKAFSGMGFEVPDSQGNFVFLLGNDPKKIYQTLKDKKILIRYLSFPKLLDGIRITVGTPSQNKILIKEIKSIIS